MAFNFLGMFATHDYLGLRDYLLQELANVNSVALQLDAEIDRIGTASIIWAEDENGNATEKRLGMYITPSDSSIAKLMRAYIARGGNPFDICDYLDPEEGVAFVASEDNPEETVMVFTQPYGGVASVRTREEPTADFDDGGELIYGKNFRLRAGKEIRNDRAEVIASHVASAREWANQGIKEKRNDLEWRIIKLLDLCEQLKIERKERLFHDVSGMLSSVEFEEDYEYAHTLRNHISTIDKIVFEMDDEDVPKYGTCNLPNLARGEFDFIIPSRQKGEDDWVSGKTPFNNIIPSELRVDVAEDLAAPDTGLDEET